MPRRRYDDPVFGGRSFVRRKRPDWERFEALLRKIEGGGLHRLSEAETLEVARLYRKTTSDLAQAQTFVRDADVLHYLNGLVGRGHGVVYRTPSFSSRSIFEFFWNEYPARVRANARFVLAAAAILFGAMLVGFSVIAFDFEARDYVLPDDFRFVEKKLAEQDHWGSEITPEAAPEVSAFIMTNNIRVSMQAFAAGVFLGIGTTIVLAFNGFQIGGIMAVLAHYGKATMLVSFVVGHGVIELTCICIAGGAGFVLASGMIAPGDRSVKDALVERGRESALLVLGTVPLLVIAGTIEGFVSPLPVPLWAHVAFAVLPASALIAYLGKGSALFRRLSPRRFAAGT
jgi:uncharacterized membrane protein SpoIIM required for sporulation